jgi:virginiamycin B lyase
VFTPFVLPRSGAGPLGISAGPDGGVWYTANNVNRVGRVDTGTGQISEYRLPTTASSPLASPLARTR